MTLVIVAMIAALLVIAAPGANAEIPSDCSGAAFTLTVFHNNDGESQVVNAGRGLETYGGAARFAALADSSRVAPTATTGNVLISSGDNFLAGPEFTVGFAQMPRVYYDAIAMELIDYDAVALGNHDFDFGPDVLGEFIDAYTDPPPYVAANLDFTGEPALQSHVDDGTIVKSTILDDTTSNLPAGMKVGVIGLDTPNLPFISSPGEVKVSDDLATIVNAEVTTLTGAGVDKIILASHLQDIDLERALAKDVNGVDVIIAGGGDELLANPGDTLIPGDDEEVFGAYPLTATNKDGDEIPVVTTSGEYRYLGELIVGFDGAGKVVCVDAASGPLVVSTAAGNDAAMQTQVVDPVEAGLAVLDATVVGKSEVPLDGLRNSVRFMETNQGNLIADSQRWKATQLATTAAEVPDVALQNGGGIRNNTILPAGDLTVLDTFDMVPFPNFLTLFKEVPRAQFKEIMENAVSRVDGLSGGTGRFAQISGFSMVYDPAATAQELDGDGKVVTAGERVHELVLDDGTVLVTDGAVVAGDPISLTIVDFLARGGDQYPFRDLEFDILGVSYQQALADYIEFLEVVSTSDYPVGGEGRILLATEQMGLVDTSAGLWTLPTVTPEFAELAGHLTPFYYGNPGDFPFVGDWDGNGSDTVGMYRQSDGFVYLRNSNTQGIADLSFFFGNPGDVPIAGDWDGDGFDTVSIYRPATSEIFIINELGEDGGGLGAADFSYVFGNPGDVPFVGDFDGDGIDTVGLFRPTTGLVYYRNTLDTGVADNTFIWGDPGDVIFAGDWNSDGTDTVGLFRASDSTFYWRNSNSAGFADGSETVTTTGTPYPVAGRFG